MLFAAQRKWSNGLHLSCLIQWDWASLLHFCSETLSQTELHKTMTP